MNEVIERYFNSVIHILDADKSYFY